MAISSKVRTAIFERDKNRCVACLSPNNLTIQHRVGRGMGGSKKYDSPAFLITMCLECNTKLESDSVWAEIGRENGWKLSRNANPPVDPESILVKVGKRWYHIDNDYNIKEGEKSA